jgi:formylglycine-generating enzyme required for sulfatase activity/energy-coupling factor transporter ATP-binding protein EcfA2
MTKLPPLPNVRDLGGDEFEKLMHQLLLAYADHEQFDYEPHGKSGAKDDGIDGLVRQGGVPGLKGAVAFQFKWLTGNLSKGDNARQIKGSLADAAPSKFKVKHYVVVTPENISPAQKRWLFGLSPRKDLKIHHWGHARISSLLRLRPDLLAEYYPETARTAAADKASRKLLAAYLDWLINDCAPLKLRAIDQGAARSGRKPLGLTSVYVDLELTFRVPENDSLPEWLSRSPEEMNFSFGSRSAPDSRGRRVAVLEALAHHPRLVLLGAPGSGKSTLAAYLALSLGEAAQGRKKSLARLGEWWKAGALLPLRVVLREFAASLPGDIRKGRAQHVWDFLEAELKRLGLPTGTADALRRTAQDAGALFLLDGLDEAREASTCGRVLEAVTEFAATVGKHCRFLLTTRPYAWEQAAAARNDWPDSYQLAEFSPEQIETFVGHWFQAVRDLGWIGHAEAGEKTTNLRQAVRRSDIQPLSSNPLLLTLMATLLANRMRLPDDRADLYDEVVKLLLQRWSEISGADRGLLDALAIPGLTLDHIREVMQQLSFNAHASCAGQEGVADIPEGELLAALKPLLLNDANKAELALDYIEKRAGLLLGQGPRGHQRQYTFPHRTFQEYLAACWLADQHDFCERAVGLARQNPAHWRGVLTFAARQAKAGRGVPVANELVHCQAAEEWAKANPVAETDWRAAVLAGEQLLEIGLAAVNVREQHRTVRQYVAGWIAVLLDKGALPVSERAKAGIVLGRLGDERKGVGLKSGVPDIDWIPIPTGPFKMGRKEGESYYDERPQFDCDVITQPFAISRYPVTVAQFQAFVDTGGYGEERFWTDAGWQWKQENKVSSPEDYDTVFQTPNHSRVGVSWFEASAFCRWLAEQVKLPVKLPSEAEWERAARHTDARTFPWGNEQQGIEQRCNIDKTGLGHTSAVGLFPSGKAVCGAADMAGDVWAWTRSEYGYYPYDPKDGREKMQGDRARVLRGGSWFYPADFARCASRLRFDPDARHWDIGFRVVASPFFAPNSDSSGL